MNKCNWCNLKNPLYIKYHVEEWGVLNINGKFYILDFKEVIHER